MRNITNKSTRVNSITRAVSMLMCLSDGANRITDISNRLNLSKATVHRLLKTLESSGFVAQDLVTRQYYMGPLIIHLASSFSIAHQSLIAYALDDMKYLRDLTDESVAIQIRIGMQRMILNELQSNQKTKYTLGNGHVAPLYTGSGGLVILSELEKSGLEILIKSMNLVPVATNTITDKVTLIREVGKTREQGYSVTRSSADSGTAGISVPIKNYVCPVALSVFGLEHRLTNMTKHLKELQRSGERISQKLLEFTWKERLADG